MNFSELHRRMIDLLNQDSPSQEDMDAWIELAALDFVTPVMNDYFESRYRIHSFDELLDNAGVYIS